MGGTTHPLMTVSEASEFLRVRHSTLYAWACRRQIQTVKVGRSLRFRRSDLEALLTLRPALLPLNGGDIER